MCMRGGSIGCLSRVNAPLDLPVDYSYPSRSNVKADVRDLEETLTFEKIGHSLDEETVVVDYTSFP